MAPSSRGEYGAQYDGHLDDIEELSKRIGKHVRISSSRLLIEGTLVKVDRQHVKVWVRTMVKDKTLIASVRLSRSSNVSWEE